MAHGDRVPHAAEGTRLEPVEHLIRPFQRFTALSTAGGVMLVLCAIIALVWANSSYADSYHHFFHETDFELMFGSWVLKNHLVHWINDALMGIFFLLVGLEIKREMLIGELASPKRAALPIAAAIGGMAIPALFYVMLNFGRDSMSGWGVPMATDIAFALGVLALLGSRVPITLKVFLTSLAIVDDLGALLVIALFYTEEIATQYLVFAGGALCVLILCNIFRVRSPLPYVVVGSFLWYFTLRSGVHATIAGVVLAMTIPATARVDSDRFAKATGKALDWFSHHGRMGHGVATSSSQRAAVQAIAVNCKMVMPPLHRIEHALHGWVAFLILPVFAIANAGLYIGEGAGAALLGPVSLGVMFGLVVGKPLGIFAAAWLAVKLNIAALPTGVTWRHVLGVGCLGGIGFTMALFIGTLGFSQAAQLEAAKMGILCGSVISALVGTGILLTCKRAAAVETASTEDNDELIGIKDAA